MLLNPHKYKSYIPLNQQVSIKLFLKIHKVIINFSNLLDSIISYSTLRNIFISLSDASTCQE